MIRGWQTRHVKFVFDWFEAGASPDIRILNFMDFHPFLHFSFEGFILSIIRSAISFSALA
jgi:hypothetical protein